MHLQVVAMMMMMMMRIRIRMVVLLKHLTLVTVQVHMPSMHERDTPG